MQQLASFQRPALLLIDMQVGLLAGPVPPFDAARLVANLNHVIAKARAAQVPIFAVRHTGPQGSPIAAGSPFWQIAPELEVDAERDTIFDKARPSCFSGTDLAEQLQAVGVRELIIGGLKTQYCVDTNCRVAGDFGFEPILIADGHSCMDTPDASASAIIAHHNTTLSGPFVKLAQAADIQF